MRLGELVVWITTGFLGSALVTSVTACGGGQQATTNSREWSQEELDELEKKWGTDVSSSFIDLHRSGSLPKCNYRYLLSKRDDVT
jgi:hypothetical protein